MTSVATLVGMAVLAVGGLVAFATYRWLQRRRVRQVERCVRDYLVGRYGTLPEGLHVNCSDDTHWPVLVDFKEPSSGARRRLQFSCPGADSSFSLLQDKEADSEPAVTNRV